jgi:hypothetical protein
MKGFENNDIALLILNSKKEKISLVWRCSAGLANDKGIF